MCGRYTLTVDKATIEKTFGGKFFSASASYDWDPTFNAAPSQHLPVIRTHNPNRIELATWGFWPETWRHSTRGQPQINARLETADTKPMFRESFRGRHCMVIADSYFEWKTLPNTKKQPFRIMLKSGAPFAMAGIYARAENHQHGDAENAPVNFAILTTKANDAVSHIHDRMPVILPLGHEKAWLPPTPAGMFVIPPFPAELMTTYPVTPAMNKVSFNSPTAIEPIVPTLQLSAL